MWKPGIVLTWYCGLPRSGREEGEEVHLVLLGGGGEVEAWQQGVQHHHTSLVVAMVTLDLEEEVGELWRQTQQIKSTESPGYSMFQTVYYM